MLGQGLDGTLSNVNSKLIQDGWGVIPRAVNDLFKSLGRKKEGVPKVTCSVMQIYNDGLFDAIADKRRERELKIREYSKMIRSSTSNTKQNDDVAQVYVQGLSSYQVTCLDDVLELMRQSTEARAKRETEMNAQSSRSHLIVQISVEIESRENKNRTVIRRAKLNLVDLAGSEKWNKNTEMGKARADELRNINTSLSALGNCISALAETGRVHVPYRDSKLTRLLQDR